MKATTAFASGSLLALSAAAPTRTENKRSATSDCSQYGETTVGNYIVYNDLWGQDNGSGSQCVTVTGVTDDSLEWSTTWSWSDNKNDVKSYSNAVVDTDSVQLSSISSMKSSWDWKYTGDSLTADVAYDMFTSSSADGSEEFEVMVWLANLNAGPISSSYSASGDAETIATPNVAGINSFSGDVYEFFTYLINNQEFDESQYLVSAGAGTEAFVGQNAEFTVSAYSLDIETGSGSSSNAVASSSSSSAASSSAPVATSSAAALSTSSPAPTTTTSASTSSAALATSTIIAPSSSAVPTSTAAQQTQAASSSTTVAQPSSTSSAAADSNCNVKYVYV
ncbi:hypothetical protein KC340_g2026 [Hortaea werneckii]|nr:hypothetical protein KC342_g2443 [Hortaea werneckii]KAI7104647.1 hypothetical protein KC339_g4407 [Hortaea werneckii]KAI7238394.1 hypothetical protein KC365_g4458 [Hortaea werneckii]KAI7335750.1 hypothetical protein KC340_g2026 [Hortaea werneckii]KAI7389670.1 hypothetical protein KC328_g8323 [Hortaea werneckii]